jgi:hypothetical protein
MRASSSQIHPILKFRHIFVAFIHQTIDLPVLNCQAGSPNPDILLKLDPITLSQFTSITYFSHFSYPQNTSPKVRHTRFSISKQVRTSGVVLKIN